MGVQRRSLDRRRRMTHRTGRDVAFIAKTTQQTVDQTYSIGERNSWKAREIFEKAVIALLHVASS